MTRLPDDVGSDAALTLRLGAIAGVVTSAATVERDRPSYTWTDTARIFADIVSHVHRNLTPDRMWLLLTTVSTIFPEPDHVRHAMREFELRSADDAMLWLLDFCLPLARQLGWPDLGIELVQDAVLVDVDFTARHDVHTGIQRVVRSTLPRWHRDQEILPVVWTSSGATLRTLLPEESGRVLEWAGNRAESWRQTTQGNERSAWSLVVPWRSTVILSEVPTRDTCPRLAAVAEFSGNRMAAIGYDCIPVVSADMLPPAEPNKFVRFLTVVKHLDRIAGISVSSTAEFRGYAQMLETQGLPGPTVVECALPADAAMVSRVQPEAESAPLVLCVGSFEPRKNHLAVLHAAERLWRDGLRFRLHFVGGGGLGREFRRAVRRLAALGRPVSMATAISEHELHCLYRTARFTVFVSVHEGYGLPVAESLSFGTPVLTTDYGSTREIGASGGAVVVDPRDDDAIFSAMRDLLTDDGLLEKLRQQIRERPVRSWDDYARQLWLDLVPVRGAVR